MAKVDEVLEAIKTLSVLEAAQFSTMFVVGTSSIFMTRVFSGCLPGYNGSSHTPLPPRRTMLPCVKCSPEMSRESSPTKLTTTPT